MMLKKYLKLLPFVAFLLLPVAAIVAIKSSSTGGDSLMQFLADRKALSDGPCPITSAPLSPRAEHAQMRFGVDLVAAKGTRVSATADGWVVFLGKCGSYGHVVILGHPGDVLTLYAHLGEALHGLSHHAFVHEGQEIGEVGPPDGITASHLHFEVWEEKAAVETRQAARSPRGSQLGAPGN